MASLVGRSLRAVSTTRWILGRQAVCWYTQGPPKNPAKPTATPATKSTGTQTSPVSPAAPAVSDGTTYSCNEYYGHNPVTYYDAEIDMSPDRIEQPSKFTPMPPKP